MFPNVFLLNFNNPVEKSNSASSLKIASITSISNRDDLR